jgi:hypothetical protein
MLRPTITRAKKSLRGLSGLVHRDALDVAITSHINLIVRTTYDAIVWGVALFGGEGTRRPWKVGSDGYTSGKV